MSEVRLSISLPIVNQSYSEQLCSETNLGNESVISNFPQTVQTTYFLGLGTGWGYTGLIYGKKRERGERERERKRRGRCRESKEEMSDCKRERKTGRCESDSLKGKGTKLPEVLETICPSLFIAHNASLRPHANCLGIPGLLVFLGLTWWILTSFCLSAK